MADLVGAIDQGTTSTRFMLFDHGGNEVGRHQLEHRQILPRAGWVEHDPAEIWERTQEVIRLAMESVGARASDLAAVGITNQRETTVVWNRRTGRPYHNAIVWQDTRTDRLIGELTRSGRGALVRERTGLPPATYFAGGKLQWILREVPGVREDAEAGEALFGTVDSWITWNLTGGAAGGPVGSGGAAHVTDVTNASRTMLMDLRTLEYDEELLGLFEVPRRMLPAIRPSADPEGHGTVRPDSPLAGVPLTGILGDQQAAMAGQVCFEPGEAKNTYGTGNFLLLNTGTEPVASDRGLITTVCHQVAGQPAVYALEGSIAVTGSAVQWLRDQLGVITSAAEIEELAASVPDSGGICFVPAFSGLFAPYWRSDARGAVVGISRFTTRAHLARATLESICYQSRDVFDVMTEEAGVIGTAGAGVEVLRVDGGVTANDLCMQVQADVLGLPVSRPVVAETTALGAAYTAGLAVGFWRDTGELRANWSESKRWTPSVDESERAEGYSRWRKAVNRTLDWVDNPD